MLLKINSYTTIVELHGDQVTIANDLKSSQIVLSRKWKLTVSMELLRVFDENDYE